MKFSIIAAAALSAVPASAEIFMKEQFNDQVRSLALPSLLADSLLTFDAHPKSMPGTKRKHLLDFGIVGICAHSLLKQRYGCFRPP